MTDTTVDTHSWAFRHINLTLGFVEFGCGIVLLAVAAAWLDFIVAPIVLTIGAWLVWASFLEKRGTLFDGGRLSYPRRSSCFPYLPYRRDTICLNSDVVVLIENSWAGYLVKVVLLKGEKSEALLLFSSSAARSHTLRYLRLCCASQDKFRMTIY